MAEQVVQTFGSVQAVRYGDSDGNFDVGAPARVAQFVLGHDVDSRVTTLNERMLDVVQPIEEFWEPDAGTADLEVTIVGIGHKITVMLGQWVVRYPSGRIRAISHNQLVTSHFPTPRAKSFIQELEELINRHSIDNESDTPDYILATYMLATHKAYSEAVHARDRHYDVTWRKS